MERAYQRVAQRLHASNPHRRPFCCIDGGRLLTGWQSLSKTRAGCRWRLFWRIKRGRKSAQLP